MSWLKEVSETPPDELICTHPGKNPSLQKIVDYCQKCRGGRGCPNLLPQTLIENKPEETPKLGFLRKRRK